MSLILHLRSVENLRGRSDRLARVTFRGVQQYSKICESCESFVLFDEVFRWNLPQALEAAEQIEIQIFNHNKYLANRLVGSFGMVLQQLVDVGHLSVSDCLLDDNNIVTQATINFDLTYNAPDPRLTQFEITSAEVQNRNVDTRPLLSPSSTTSLGRGGVRNVGVSDAPDAPLLRYQRSSIGQGYDGTMQSGKIRSMRTIGKMMRLVKKSKRHVTSAGVQSSKIGQEMDRSSLSGDSEALMSAEELEAGEDWSRTVLQTQRHLATNIAETYSLNKTEDYQVSVTIIEARQLSGINMSPVVCVQVGDQKKYTSVKESTNCPYYNEYFVFDFNIIASVLFDKIITISVLHSRNLLRSGTKIGSFKLDVGTVYNAPGHHFYHKWAILTDPDDAAGGPKGYVKCDIAVFGKGDKIKVPLKKFDADEDDIEANLLVPDGSPSERQKARFVVTIYKAEGLPRMTSGIVANVKKAFTGESKDLVDPYVMVVFAGHQGRTSVKKGKYDPVWNEEIVFTEMFPPFCRRVKVQVRDDSVNDEVIATHFTDLSTVSNDNENGFLPTFGPSWVNLYGSIRAYSIIEELAYLNEGISPGIQFRGRLLISLKTELIDPMSESLNSCPPVEVGPCLPVSESALGPMEEFHLLGVIFEVNMIDRKLNDRAVQFEISIGNYGNVLDGRYFQSSDSAKRPLSSAKDLDYDVKNTDVTGSTDVKERGEESDQGDGAGDNIAAGDEKVPLLGSASGSSSSNGHPNSLTSPMMPTTTDKYYYNLVYGGNKPCLWTSGIFEDHRLRLCNSNLLFKMSDQLEHGLEEVENMVKLDKGNPDKKLKVTLENLSNACSRYLTLTSTKSTNKGARTKLDKERLKYCRSEVEAIGSCVRLLRPTLNSSNVKDKLKSGHDILTRLKRVRSDPQHGLPDVFIWMVQNKKRVAYQRIRSRDILYSGVEEEKGKDCGQVQTLLLRMPNKKSAGGWTLQARLQIYLWLGPAKQKKNALNGLPEGFQVTTAIKNMSKPGAIPPTCINYADAHSYQLRAHMYQARGLIGSDDSGLSDPFARVVIGQHSLSTRVIDQTLNPSWDEMLIFRDVLIYATVESVKESPPEVVVEIFDRDRVGKSEFIGRAVAYPVVKASKEKYEAPLFPPKLKWHDVFRGDDRAGELLAAFELLQLASPGESSCNDLPPCELPTLVDSSRSFSMPVPKGIRPALSTYRIEILFWGVRDLKRIQLLPVEKPRIDVECSSHVISSTVIKSCRKTPNFLCPVKYMDVDLPDNDLYCPPITIRCVDCRNFGRFVLVGNHVIDNIRRFIFTPPLPNSKQESAKKLIENFEFSQQSILPLPPRTNSAVTSSKMASDVIVVIEDEKMPLITKHESIVTIETVFEFNSASLVASQSHAWIKEEEQLKGSNFDPRQEGKPMLAGTGGKQQQLQSQQQQLSKDSEDKNSKTASKKKKTSIVEEEDLIMEGLDWWTKYHASLVCQETESHVNQSNQDIKRGSQSAAGCQSLDRTPNGRLNPALMQKGTAINSDPNLVCATAGSDSITAATAANLVATSAIAGGVALTSNFGAKSDVDAKVKMSSLRLSKAATSLVAKLSPKSQRRKDKKYVNWAKLKVYPGELETEFNHFKEWLHTFDLHRGKKGNEADDDENRIVGKFKGAIVIYKLPLPSDIGEGLLDIGGNLKIYRSLPTGESKTEIMTSTPPNGGIGSGEDGPPINSLFQGLPSNEPLHVLVRIYLVKAVDLHPADLNGKADPYIVIRLGQTTINDKENYISKQLNPVFGKCFEVEATFPHDSLLKVQIYDWDLIGTDDIIGETVIDLESRYFSRHRATCGLALQYDADGYNAWRDPMKPTQILAKLCKDYKLDGPFYQPGRVRIGNRIFNVPTEYENETGTKTKSSDEHLALAVLHHWEEMPKVGCKLVAEHVETRPLFHPEKPGMEQGKLEMWVDMFPIDMPAPGPPVDISPRKPKSYELRVIIWNTDDVVLEDDAFFTGEKMSDIYVKGWVKGQEDMQSTDIHYRSLTGEGNFNWRFIFPFEYLVAEEKVVISKKDTMFSWDETETKIPARLYLQVWDADHFSADDFLGAMTFDLTQFPRGAKTSKQCTLDMLKTDGSVPQMNLFKHKRVKGWWPFYVKVSGEEMELTGKVEAELHLLTVEEAEKHPAGQGRGEPDPLEKPNRPDTSFIWFLNPIKSLKYILWHNYRWLVLKIILVILLGLLLALFFYSLPGYTVKKMLGA